jgi:hypothetical protein
MKISIQQGKKNHSKIAGTIRFVPIDGEGTEFPPPKFSPKCNICSIKINGTKISTEPYIWNHPNCYYNNKSMPIIVKESISPMSLQEITEEYKYHPYVLFGVGQVQIETDNECGLTIQEILTFLYHEFEKYPEGTAYVGYFLSYDFTQWFKWMREERARYLFVNKPGISCWKCHVKLRNGICPSCHKIQPCAENRKHVNPRRFPHFVDYDGWQIDIIPGKRFRFRPKDCNCEYATCGCSVKKRPIMFICDVGSFFQTKFENVINPEEWAEGTCPNTAEEYIDIKVGKDKRGKADVTLDDNMRLYNRKENELLERVMKLLDAGFRELDIILPPSGWMGPGQPAGKWLEKHGVSHVELFGQKKIVKNNKIVQEYVKRIVPKYFEESCRASYLGGWFEIFIHGLICNWIFDESAKKYIRDKNNPRYVYEYDLNSAYPFNIAHLVCLKHGKYSHGKGIPSVNGSFNEQGLWEGDLVQVNARVYTPGHSVYSKKITKEYGYVGAMLNRDRDGRINRPHITEVRAWYHELIGAIEAGFIEPLREEHCFEWVKYIPCDCPPPLAEVEDLYYLRKKIKEENGGKDTPFSKCLKLIMNSLYGKEAQSIGFPAFGNPIYASLITAGCRTMITRAIATHPDGMKALIMNATDGCYFLSPHPGLPISDKLGEWSCKKLSNLFVFKPGVYWHDESIKKLKFKSRGFNPQAFIEHIDDIVEEMLSWDKDNPPQPSLDKDKSEFPKVIYKPGFTIVTAIQALMQNHWERAGCSQQNVTVDQSADPIDKRWGMWWDTNFMVFRSMPYDYGWNVIQQFIHESINEIGFYDKEHGSNAWIVSDYDWKMKEYVQYMIDLGYIIIKSENYKKRFGTDDPYSIEYKEQYGIAWDEYAREPEVLDILREK